MATQTLESITRLPDYLEDFTKKNLATAESVASRPYQPYQGPRVAGFTPSQSAAFNLAQGQATGQPWKPYTSAAYGTMAGSAGNLTGDANFAKTLAGQAQGQAGTFSGIGRRAEAAGAQAFPNADLAAYMNPFTQSAIRATTDEMQRNSDIQRNMIKAEAAQGNAFGGDRQAVLEAENQRNTERAIADVIAQMQSQNFTQAQQQFNVDRSSTLQGLMQALGAEQGGTQALGTAANTNVSAMNASAAQAQIANNMAKLGELVQDLGYKDVGALFDIGGREQARGQTELDLAYQDFLRQFNYPIEMLNLLLSSARAQPYTTTTQREELAPNSTAQTLGGIASLAGGIFGGGGIGSIFG